MGVVPPRNKLFSAQGRGHAHAVSQAIEFLSSEVLPEAIERDHRLHDEGGKPDGGLIGHDRPSGPIRGDRAT